MPAQRSRSARGPYADSIRRNFDLSKLENISDVDQFSIWQFSGRVQDHHVGPASNGEPLSWLARQQGKNGRQIAGRDKFVFGWIGSHFVTLRRAAFDTASKICM